jgi:ribosomal protein S18 acetylase RimI-like enzyme
MQDPKMVFWTTLPNFLLVATHSDEVVGIVAIQKKADKLAELNRLSVAPEARGLGVGKALVEAAISKSRQLGYGSIYLATGQVRKNAMRLYEKVGFKLIGEFSGKISFFVPIPPSFHGIAIREYFINLEDPKNLADHFL